MNDQLFQALIKRIQAGEATTEEQVMIEKWLDARSHTNLFEALSEAEQQAIRNDILVNVNANISAVSPQAKQRSYLLFYKIAASVLVLLSIGIGSYFYQSREQSPLRASDRETDLEPGGNKAMLQLADGSVLDLTSAQTGVLTEQGNSSVKKIDNGEVVYDIHKAGGKPSSATTYNTITIPNGGEYKIVLPDGTKVWLNASSSLKFPTVFAGRERNVELTGEAYFEVAKNASIPFHVKTETQDVEVLGTHFNINAYRDKPGIRTTLLEGSIKISNTQHPVSRILHPGQQAIVTSTETEIGVTAADTEEVLAWKNGLFQFSGADIREVMQQFERWYDVKVKYEGEIPPKKISGKMFRNIKASQALQILSYLKIHYRIEQHPTEKRIVITP